MIHGPPRYRAGYATKDRDFTAQAGLPAARTTPASAFPVHPAGWPILAGGGLTAPALWRAPLHTKPDFPAAGAARSAHSASQGASSQCSPVLSPADDAPPHAPAGPPRLAHGPLCDSPCRPSLSGI